MVSMNKTDLARALPWTLAALSLLLTLAGLAATWRAGEAWLDTHLLFGPVTAIAYALVGALVAARQPRNPIGWIFSAVGVFAGLTLLSSRFEMVVQSGQVSLPVRDIVGWLSLWVWMPVTILPLTFVLLLFPDGRLPSARWWPGCGSIGFPLRWRFYSSIWWASWSSACSSGWC